MASEEAPTELGTLIKQSFGIEFAKLLQGERRAGAAAQQTLAPGAVGGLDAHRAVHGKANAMRPLPDRLCVIGRQQAAVHDDAQQSLAHARLHGGEGWRIEPGGGMIARPAR